MKGKTRNKEELEWQDKIAQYGCYCCREMGIENDYILIHHTDGRTKPGAHFRVIPLCSYHHDYHQTEGLHANTGAWRKKWGRESEILFKLSEWVNGNN